MNRKVTINRDGSTWHYLVARHADGTVTTLCAYERVVETPPRPPHWALCSHCDTVLRELNAAARSAVAH
jgi:hypothetical protein